MNSTLTLQPIPSEGSGADGYDVLRFALETDDPEAVAVAVCPMDCDEGVYVVPFWGERVDPFYIGRLHRDPSCVVVGPARLVTYQHWGLIDPDRPFNLTIEDLGQLWKARDLFPWLDVMYRLSGEAVLRHPETGRFLHDSEHLDATASAVQAVHNPPA